MKAGSCSNSINKLSLLIMNVKQTFRLPWFSSLKLNLKETILLLYLFCEMIIFILFIKDIIYFAKKGVRPIFGSSSLRYFHHQQISRLLRILEPNMEFRLTLLALMLNFNFESPLC